MRARTSASQACGSMSFIFALTIRLYITAARSPPRSEPQNSHDLRPKVMPRGALGPWAIAVAVEFLDLQFQMGDQRLVVGLLSSGSRSLRACDDQGRFQRFDVVWSGFTTRIHTQIESQILAEDSSKIEASATILHVPDETYEADSANRFHRAYTPTARPRFQLRRPSVMAR
jgi:hypothetical protein